MNDKQVILKTLVERTPWNNVKPALLAIDPGKKNHTDAYSQLYKTLQGLDLEPTDMALDIVRICEDGEWYVDVSGRKFEDGSKEILAIQFVPWAEWLSMPVSESICKEFDDAEILANCLEEMAFEGFTQETIANKVDALCGQANDILEGKEATIPLSELMEK